MKTYKFRLYPKQHEADKLDVALEVCRQTYNHLLEQLNAGFTQSELQNHILDMKCADAKLDCVHSKVLQMENHRLFSNLSSLSAVKKQGRKVGRLRFKGKRWFKTFQYNQSGFKLLQSDSKNGLLWLSKIGNIPIRLHRKVQGSIKNITMKKSLGKWYCSVVTDYVDQRSCGTEEIGIDVGVMNYVYDSEGNIYDNPRHFDRYHDELKMAQKSLSKKARGSNSRRKQAFTVAKIHNKIANARDDFIHKLSRKLINRAKFIAVERLNIKKLMSISYNARNIADCSWGKHRMYLHYKAESAGCVVQDVDPAYSTMECSHCHYINPRLELWQREFRCGKCNVFLPRDFNSAIIILARGKELASMETCINTHQSGEQMQSMKSEATSSKSGEAR
jgi:putative transposase